MTITRRRFSLGLAATAAAAAMRPSAADEAAPPKSPAPLDVLVIGAGLSGLESALLLEEMGANVQVIEARQRVGGRVYTLFDRPGYPEVGGNSCAVGYGRMLNRIRAMGLEVQDTSARRAKFPGMELVMNSRILKREEWARSPLNPLPEKSRSSMPWEFGGAFIAANNPLKGADPWMAESAAPLDVSMHDWLAAHGLDDPTINTCWSINPYFGTSAYDVSAVQCLFNASWGKAISAGGTSMYSVVGGNQKLPMAMAKKLRREVHLGKAVVAIRDDGTLVEVTCRDGSRYRAKSVVCSIPFSVLRHVYFEPQLTGRQAEAVNTLPYMVNTVAYFTPRKKYWEADGLNAAMWTNGPVGTVSPMRFGTKDEDVTSMVANPRGNQGVWIDRLTPKDALALIQAEIERLRPAARGALEDGFIYSWERDPYAGGDWAVFAPGQVQRFAREMALPHGRVHFCGEHTGQANRGMEAAMESAERAVLELA